MTKFKFLPFIDILVGCAALAHAGFDEGKAAYGRGDYAKAYKEFKELVDQEHAKAQFDLGWTYELGQGALQNPPASAKTIKPSNSLSSFNRAL
ncbi:MAG: hypothetical protein ABSG35_11930 [Syntrophobacteraceae bacterium]|jgi:TPR repeat protein